MEESYAAQQLQLQRAQDIISQDGPSLSIQELLSKNISLNCFWFNFLNRYDDLIAENQTYIEQVSFSLIHHFQIRALQAIVREYQGSPSTYDQESARVIEKNLQATEAQLRKTEVNRGFGG